MVHSKRPHQVPVARIHRLGEGIQGRHIRSERLRGAVGVVGFRGDRVRASVGWQRGARRSQKRRKPSASADAVDVRLGAHDGAEIISRDGVRSHAMARES